VNSVDLDSKAADQMQLARRAAVPTAFRSCRLTHVVVTASASGQEPSTSGRAPQQQPGAAPQQQRRYTRMPTGPNGRPLIMGPEGQPVEVRLGHTHSSLLVGSRQHPSTHAHLSFAVLLLQMVRLDEVPEAFSGIAAVDRGEDDNSSPQ
jgi:hypothetical protein